jgi:hypothetical protein
MADDTPRPAIRPERAFYILVKAREFDAKEEMSDPNSGSNPSDDKDVDVLEDSGNDPTFEELMGALDELNIDEQLDLLAAMWIGRGDFGADEWSRARGEAAAVADKHIPLYLVETPLLSDYLEEGLTGLGYSFEELERNHL